LGEGNVIHELDVERWAFWSPESPHPATWSTHWASPAPAPSSVAVPDDAIPAGQRRRMSSLTRLAVQIAIEAADDCKPDFLIFCSQHGDLTRLREMLDDISSGVELSPTTFSQSVHNASAGLFTIISGSTAPMSALAAGRGTFVAGWLEAEGFLVAHPDARVLLVTYDEPLPAEYASYCSQAPCAYAVGLLLRRAAGRPGVTLRAAQPEGNDDPLPLAPLFLAWMLSSNNSLQASVDGQGWIWTRTAT
jgi:Beta-ketoacyl synthase, N-terminal domain